MAAKKSIARESDRSAKTGAKRASPSRESQGAAPKQKDKPEPHRTESRGSSLDVAPSLAERVEAQREQLFKALSIVECCKFATATLLEVDDSEYMVPAFEAICDLLNTSAGELEVIAAECQIA
ncbi:MAG: hypothetical protein AB7G51_11925 [Steroidobacteraceae bacterium]